MPAYKRTLTLPPVTYGPTQMSGHNGPISNVSALSFTTNHGLPQNPSFKVWYDFQSDQWQFFVEGKHGECSGYAADENTAFINASEGYEKVVHGI